MARTTRSGTRPRALALAAAALGACAAALATQGPRGEARAQGFPLEVEEIRELVARCIRFSDKVPTRPDLTIAVVDTEGNSLGVFHESDVPADADFLDPNGRARRAARALAKAGTASYFSSDEESFTTRTAEFIIEDHFPPGVRFMPAGPLYGVEFSSFGTTDVNPITLPVPAAGFETRVRGELGGIGLFKDGRRVGGLGEHAALELQQRKLAVEEVLGRVVQGHAVDGHSGFLCAEVRSRLCDISISV